MKKNPFEEIIDSSENLLIAGMGGGFDLLCGIPIYYMLDKSKNIFLSNYSFTSLGYLTNAKKYSDYLYKIDKNSVFDTEFTTYFPEKYISEFTGKKVYCIKHESGVSQMKESLEAIINENKIDTVLMVDGGIDSILRGDEYSLGTPEEDSISLCALGQIKGVKKIIGCTAFGAEKITEISHCEVLERIADLTKKGSFLGAWSIVPETEAGKKYRECAEYALSKHPERHKSVIASSMLSALSGEFGDYHLTKRTATPGNELFINPLMNVFWFFDLDGVYRQNLYMDEIKNTTSIKQVAGIIHNFRNSIKDSIPYCKKLMPI